MRHQLKHPLSKRVWNDTTEDWALNSWGVIERLVHESLEGDKDSESMLQIYVNWSPTEAIRVKDYLNHVDRGSMKHWYQLIAIGEEGFTTWFKKERFFD